MPPKSPKSAPSRKPSGKKPPAKRSPRKGGDGYPLKALLAALLLLVFLVASLILLSQFRRHMKPEPPPPPPSAERREAGREDRGKEVEREMETALPEEQAAEEPETAPQAEGELSGEPEPRPVLPPFPPRPDGAPARLAIIMDDLGRDMATGRALLEIGIPITFAILPDQANSARLAEFAHRNGREIIVHLPMEPRGFPVTNPGDEALFVDLPAEEVQKRVRSFIARVPHAVGGNNHMGSRFTESREGMQAALSVMKDADLFFVDSLTSGRSVAFEEARQAGMPSAVRDVFLDNVQEVGAISAQIAKLAQLAQTRGQAVGICHPHPQTLAALRLAAPELSRMGIEVVPVSALLQR